MPVIAVPYSRRLPLAACAAMLAMLPSFPAIAAESVLGQQAVAGIMNRIEQRDCTAAVAGLKAGLKREFAEVALLAGSMYDNGVCVKRNWERAALFYAQAWHSGMREAADRLAAGHADPENGVDVASALWWSSRGRGRAMLEPGPLDCSVGPAAAGDIDRFVAELQTWPQPRLAACNYITGVMATLSAEIKYPALARTYGVGGNVDLRFLPAVPRIDMQKGESREYQLLGVFNGDALRERSSSRVTGTFEKALGDVADRALRRYPQPGGIPAGTTIRVRYMFELE